MNVTPAIADFGARHILAGQGHNAMPQIGFHARLALDDETRRDAFRLRHLCYHSNGHIEARPNGEFSDPYDSRANNTTIVIYDAGHPVASVRVCTMDLSSEKPTERDLPLGHVFPDELAALVPAGGRAVELNRLVRHPDHAHSQKLVFILFRIADFIIRQHDPDIVASCVRNNHVGFYRRLRFEHVAGPRQYTGLNFMTNFLACHRASYEQVRRNIPVLRISPAACALYEGLLDGETVPVFGDE